MEPRKSNENLSHTLTGLPAPVREAFTLVKTEKIPEGAKVVRGYDFNEGVDYSKLFASMSTSGFQATSVGESIKEINAMIDCKFEGIPEDRKVDEVVNPCGRKLTNCTIFLSYTSNMISAGTRESIRFLVQHNMVDCIVVTAGGIEEDFMKCLAPTYNTNDFTLQGQTLRNNGMNRIGNLVVPNTNYALFDNWMMPIVKQMVIEQNKGTKWTPSKVIARLGKEIDNPESVYYWAYKNNIPVFSPAITDGAIGDVLFFHSYVNPGLEIDIVEDVKRMNLQAVCAVNSGMIILGGGLVKHHTCNANSMRNGADYTVFVNTANEFDGSDSGARPDEAVSWGKIKGSSKPVKVYGEATVIFPILVAETFASRKEEFKNFYSHEKTNGH